MRSETKRFQIYQLLYAACRNFRMLRQSRSRWMITLREAGPKGRNLW